MHADARRIKDLFLKHPNVKLCLSGHIHLRDSLEYNGVTYACNGAVCGNWWQGNYQETKPGYAIVDLWNDGTHKIEYVTY
jgi:3',5'-cyclic-AMP phosphodiesterase